ncbi:MAG: hypothetical protein ABIF19_01325 [Planctomycetota bacterium]
MTELKHENEELVPQANQPPADLSAFTSIVEKWIETQAETERLGHQVQMEELSVIREANRRNFHLLFVIIICVFTMSAGIIFFMKNIEAGFLLLSHVGAVVAGLLAGMGLQRKRQKDIS